jgi:hypothetical protein
MEAALEAATADLRAQTISECKRAVLRAAFGSPSNWGSDRPKGWHLDRPCDAWEAAMHDNGINDGAFAIIRLKK